jgi:ubiquinone/menaquinone biosynthesis C-methylase UbiE
MNHRNDWERIYATNPARKASWYQRRPDVSLALIQRTEATPRSRILDVGGGASTLADHLIDGGYRYVTVIDVAMTALQHARERLGARGLTASWIQGDVTAIPIRTGSIDVWHDRAVFHFLTDPAERLRYVEEAHRAIAPGGAIIIATFAEDGPTRCSGFDVQRYSQEELGAALGGGFTPVRYEREVHHTPAGGVQHFTYGLLRRR